MYDLKKRAYISTLGELRSLLSTLPDDTEISGAGALGAWLHFKKCENLVCIDPECLYDCYEEYDDEEVGEKEEEQVEEHKARLKKMTQEIINKSWNMTMKGVNTK